MKLLPNRTPGTRHLLVACVTLAGAAGVVQPASAGPIAGSAAAAEVVVKGISVISAWLAAQSSGCVTVAYAEAWANHANTVVKSDSDTGWLSAYAVTDPAADNGCGHGFAQALAQQGLLGNWGSLTVDPWTSAWTYGLHFPGDSHGALAYAKARAAGRIKVDYQETPPRPEARGATAGDVFLEIAIPALQMSATAGGGPSSSKWTFNTLVDGLPVFSSTAYINELGELSVTGDIDANLFAVSSIGDRWNVTLPSFTTSIFLTHLAPGLRSSAEFDIETNSNLDDGAAAANVPGPGPLAMTAIAGMLALPRGSRRDGNA